MSKGEERPYVVDGASGVVFIAAGILMVVIGLVL
jgi:hypothetical protein